MNPIKVLLIDDEVEFSAVVARRLGRRGMLVATASGGQQGLDHLADHDVDVVVLDIKMPGMDGVKTLGEIKRRHPKVEVVMLTAHANTDIVISSLAMGAFDYLMKPADMKELIRKVEDAVLRRKGNLGRGDA